MFLIFIVVLLEFSINVGFPEKNSPPLQCGIPILMWHEVLFSLFGVRSLANLLKIYIIRNFYSRRNYYNVMRFVIIDGTIIAWLVYGNMIYYSKKNNCDDNERTQFLDQFMGCIIVLGYIMMAFYLLILCTIPCLFLLLRYNQAGLAQNIGGGAGAGGHVN